MENEISNYDGLKPLALNIRYLRKRAGISQEALAKQLGIKRSNIAAYEIKNVEPRLRIILEIARFFKIDLKSLIQTIITDKNYDQLLSKSSSENHVSHPTIEINKEVDVEEFISKSMKIRKVLEGFKAFYSFKKERTNISTPERDKLMFDIENFLQLMDHLLNYNESVIRVLSEDK
jgi:transcriptional regulator with XRE-family HTH domain